MTSVETTIVTTALPAVGASLNGLALQNWIFTIYLVTTAVSTTVYGRVAASFGRKPVFLVGLALFAVGSLMSGLSVSMPELIVFHGLMGLGAAPEGHGLQHNLAWGSPRLSDRCSPASSSAR